VIQIMCVSTAIENKWQKYIYLQILSFVSKYHLYVESLNISALYRMLALMQFGNLILYVWFFDNMSSLARECNSPDSLVVLYRLHDGGLSC
jgi:hypothetical protein